MTPEALGLSVAAIGVAGGLGAQIIAGLTSRRRDELRFQFERNARFVDLKRDLFSRFLRGVLDVRDHVVRVELAVTNDQRSKAQATMISACDGILEWSPAEWCTTDLSERVPPT
jgi:hypothetical protein